MMEERTWSWVNKSTWGDGPWSGEPDKMQFTDPETGLPCLIRRNPHSGVLCGYVGVGPDHPLYGKDYSDDAVHEGDVHGGLTYSAACTEEDPEHGICHIGGDFEPAWWFGFDCAHSWDIAPGFNDLELSLNERGSYKDVAYVQAECLRLARQLAVSA